MRQTLNVLGLVFSLVLTLSGGAILFYFPGVTILVLGTLLAMIGLLFVGMSLARILSHIDNNKQLTLKYRPEKHF